MTTRNYSSRSQQTTLTSAVTAGASSMVVVSGTALLGGQSIPGGTTFTIVLDPDTAIEEIVDATAVSTNTFTITRAIDGSTAQSHSAGAVVRHMAIGRDYREANQHIEATTAVHGLGVSSAVVGTTDAQTLTNKILTAPTITNPSISGAGVDASIVFEGATPDAFETTLTVVDPTQDNTVTLPNTTGTVVLATAAQTLTNKTMGDVLNAGGFKITNLATPTDASDAVRKDFADAQVAAAATSATSAATSASSAATSATAAATSATSAAASATSATTSASSASASATAAATSASSAATSASDAATTYDNFDDRYLGSKSTAPTVDNDGNTLLVGAIYWNSTLNNMYVWSGTAWVQIATTSSYSAPTLGSTVLTSATTISTVTGLTENNLTLTGTLTAGASSGTNGQVLQSTGTGTQWGTVSGYSAPTLGSTVINSGATVSTVTDLTLTTPTFTNPTSVMADLNGYTTTVTTGGDTTLTATSTRYQSFTGSSSQNIILPVVSTLKLGWEFQIANNMPIGSNRIVVQSSGVDDIIDIPAGMSAILTCIAITGTNSASWSAGLTSIRYSATNSGSGFVVFDTVPVLDQPKISTINSASATGAGAIYNSITTAAITMAAAQTSGTLTFANASNRTGAVNIANATTSSHTVAIANGVTASGNTKTVNIGTAGAAGSTTNIALGSTTGTSNITLNGNLTATPAQGTVTTASTGVGYMGIPASAAAATGAYTIVAADAGEHIYSTATRTITIPANGTTAFPIGTAITFIAATGTTVTIAITTDTLLLAGTGTTGSRTLAPFGVATAIKITSTSWIISGNGLT
jgi:hypothetical protein